MAKRKASFVSEIRKLMHGFGDYVNPSRQSAGIIEQILRQQMNSMLVQLSTTAEERNSENIGHEDVLFLMRKDKVKLRHLLKFIKYKDDQDAANLLYEIEDRAMTVNLTRDVKKEPTIVIETCGVKEKPVLANSTCDTKEKPVLINETYGVKEKPILVNETCDPKEKPVLVNETFNTKEKPELVSEAFNSKEKPVLINETCNSKEKSITANSIKKPVDSISEVKEEPTTIHSICDTKEEPIPVLEKQTVIMLDTEEDTEVKQKIQLKKRLGDCLEFLTYIDETEELSTLLDDKEIYDETEFERVITQNQLTLSLDQAQYLDFEEERRSTFITEIFTGSDFEDWLYRDHVVDLRPTKLALEMIGYLAHETVATIVDLCLLLKRDRKVDRLERIETVPMCNTGFPTLQIFNYVPSDDEDDDYYYPPSKVQCEPKPPPPPPPPPLPSPKVIKRRKLQHPNCITAYDLQEVIFRFYNQKSLYLLQGDLDNIEAAKKLFCC